MNNPRPELILFYNGPFSQWYSSPFKAITSYPSGDTNDTKYQNLNAEHIFANCEQYMMFEKAMLFQDFPSACAIIATTNPKEVKRLGRLVRGFDERIWAEHREVIVFAGNYHKFTQNPDLKQYLANSGKKIFVEASPTDKIWGIGLDANNPAARDPKKWQGLNLLGYAITAVRNKLFPSKLTEEKK